MDAPEPFYFSPVIHHQMKINIAVVRWWKNYINSLKIIITRRRKAYSDVDCSLI
jgi:hypothetical protein